MYQLEFCSTMGWCIVGGSPQFKFVDEAKVWAKDNFDNNYTLRLVVINNRRPVVARRHKREWE